MADPRGELIDDKWYSYEILPDNERTAEIIKKRDESEKLRKMKLDEIRAIEEKAEKKKRQREQSEQAEKLKRDK